MPEQTFKLAIADDSPLDRLIIRSVVSEFPQIDLVMEATNGCDLLIKWNAKKVDLLLLDLFMPILDGWETLEKLNLEMYKGKISCMSNLYHSSYKIKLPLNVNYIPKRKEEIRELLSHFVDGKEYHYQGEEEASPALNESMFQLDLNSIEVEILQALSEGFGYLEISHERIKHLSPRTIETYVQRMMARYNINSKIQMVCIAYAHGIIKPL